MKFASVQSGLFWDGRDWSVVQNNSLLQESSKITCFASCAFNLSFLKDLERLEGVGGVSWRGDGTAEDFLEMEVSDCVRSEVEDSVCMAAARALLG